MSVQSIKQICISFLFCLLVPVVTYAGAAKVPVKQTETLPATIIQFSETEQGSGTNPVIMTVTDKYLRIDDSIKSEGSLSAEGSLPTEDSQQAKGSSVKHEQGFVLYDREKKIIYSVSAEEQQIVSIKLNEVTIPSPMELKLRSATLPTDKKAPLIAGKKTQHQQLYVNDKLCYNVISVPGLLPDVAAAMGEFNQVLAGQQADTLRFIPADLHEACDLVRHTFYPKKHLEYGFPLVFQVMDEMGQVENVKYSRILTDFKQQDVSSELFLLPKYSIVPIN